MTFSVDDLVNSLNSSHIGQEAIDLAALQAQLAQSLRHASRGQPASTPLSCTPSTSFANWSFEQRAGPSRRGSVSSSSSSSNDHSGGWSGRRPSISAPVDSYSYADEMDEDERMVEELLMPSSPTPHQSNHQMTSSSMSSQQNTDSGPSLFTTTDPFYLSALQQAAAANTPSSSSVFAQNAILNPSSPFAMHQQYHQQYQHNGFKSYAAAF